MSKVLDLTGMKFNRLLIVERATNNEKGEAFWKCICDCGNSTIVRASQIKSGRTKSCGCYQVQRAIEANTKHNLAFTRVHKIWDDMKYRCNNPNDNRYHNYGGRGISVCSEWANDFMAFYNWAINNNYSDNLTIDRIDVNGNYEPSNCRWATNKEQCNNKRTNRLVTINGITKTVKQWAEISGINRTTITQRIDSGWPFYELLLPVWSKKHKRIDIL